MTETEVPTATPPRHNYANPHTPIASIKRPRSSLERPSASTASANGRTPQQQQQLTSPGLVHKGAGSSNGSNTAMSSPMPPRSSRRDEASAMSPMHPPKAVHRDPNDHVEEDDSSWVGRKVDALFSPVLSFLSQHEDDKATEDDGHQEGKDENNLDNYTTPTVSDTSSSPSHGHTEDEEDDVSCVSLQPMEEDHADDDEFNPWQYIKTLPPYAMVSHLCPQVTLPAKLSSAPPITLVLDLDETLVHCTVEPISDADLTFPVEFHGTTYQVHVRLRPFLQNFLKKIRGQYEVIVFTASQKVYANELLNLIDPEGVFIHHRLFRESCMAVEGNFLKDLNVLGRDLTKTVIVDNSPHAFGFQVDNGIPIESWFDDPNDRELLKLAKFLEKLKTCKDVRPLLRERFRCHERIADATAPL
jgi:CTD small phosphatase-like protein 2